VFECNDALARASLWASIRIDIVILLVPFDWCAASLFLEYNTLTAAIPSAINSLPHFGEFVGRRLLSSLLYPCTLMDTHSHGYFCFGGQYFSIMLMGNYTCPDFIYGFLSHRTQ
jgi:hypothetical protein